ncbi:hypothetical protein [Neosynechococcus sphagnicola]|uniref:hypothetical protein n=1 Tax=Neosynechococcus sphagnicola TaxID=1501145 RepID=UPI001EF9D7E5|nr:hypothetical protein [Neosynechococcus sphagnicola]
MDDDQDAFSLEPDLLRHPLAGAEVGSAELHSLADLFEGDIPDLEISWQEDAALEESFDNTTLDQFAPPSPAESSEFADLFLEETAPGTAGDAAVDDLMDLLWTDMPVAEASTDAMEPDDFPSLALAEAAMPGVESGAPDEGADLSSRDAAALGEEQSLMDAFGEGADWLDFADVGEISDVDWSPGEPMAESEATREWENWIGGEDFDPGEATLGAIAEPEATAPPSELEPFSATPEPTIAQTWESTPDFWNDFGSPPVTDAQTWELNLAPPVGTEVTDTWGDLSAALETDTSAAAPEELVDFLSTIVAAEVEEQEIPASPSTSEPEPMVAAADDLSEFDAFGDFGLESGLDFGEPRPISSDEGLEQLDRLFGDAPPSFV